MIKIYVQNKPLFLVDTLKGEAEAYVHRSDTIFISELRSSTVKAVLEQLEQPGTAAGILLHSSTAELLTAVAAHLTRIVAAGGLVRTPDDHFLLILRKGKWDLPKGKLDEGEDLESCALREINEETGAGSLSIERPLHISYHIYYEKGQHILKESHWFLTTAPSKTLLTPQTEEDIERCEWVPVNDLPAYKANMHASIIDVINTGMEAIRKNG